MQLMPRKQNHSNLNAHMSNKAERKHVKLTRGSTNCADTEECCQHDSLTSNFLYAIFAILLTIYQDSNRQTSRFICDNERKTSSKIASIERQCSRITAQKTHRLRLGRTQKLADERLRFQYKRTGRRSGFPLLCEQHGAIRGTNLVQIRIESIRKNRPSAHGRTNIVQQEGTQASFPSPARHVLRPRRRRVARQHLHLHVCDKPVFFP